MSNFSFSVKEPETLTIVKSIQKHCRAKGISFSYIVLQALKEYWEKRNG